MTSSKVPGKQQNYSGRDGLIHSIYSGDQTGAKVKKAGDKLAILVNKARTRDQKALVLIDTTRMGDVNLAARKMILLILQELDYDFCAIFGCNSTSSGLVNLMIIASGRGFKIRVFDSQKEAKRWLLAK